MNRDSNSGLVTNRRKRIRWLTGVLSLVVVCGFMLVRGLHIVTPQWVEAAIVHDLSQQSDLAAVRRFMDAHHIVYAGYSDQFHIAYGKIYWSSVTLFMKGQIFVEFTFNENEKLASHKVVERYQFLWE